MGMSTFYKPKTASTCFKYNYKSKNITITLTVYLVSHVPRYESRHIRVEGFKCLRYPRSFAVPNLPGCGARLNTPAMKK